MHETEEMEMSSKPIGFIPKDRADDPRKGCCGDFLAGVYCFGRYRPFSFRFFRDCFAGAMGDSSGLFVLLDHEWTFFGGFGFAKAA